MKSILASLLLLLPVAAAAQESPQSCPAFDGAVGPEIVFADNDRLQEYGYSSVSFAPRLGQRAQYADLVGKRARIVGQVSGEGTMFKFFHAVLEDCRSIYLVNALDEPLSRKSASSYDFEYVGENVDAKIEAVRPGSDWMALEKVDPMTDAKSCHVTPSGRRAQVYPMFFYHSVEGFSVTLVGADFPGKRETFRVDKNQAISETEGLSGARAQALVTQARSGRVLRVAGYEWPYEIERYEEFNLEGLGPKLDQCRAFVRR